MPDVTDKIVSLAQLAETAAEARQIGQRVVMCHGVFDVLHVGHLRYLEEARAMGDMTAARERLVASLKITEDEAVQAELDAIDAAWSMVSLKLAKDHEGSVPLRPRMPFVDPVQRQALEVAKKALSTDGRFQGLLPVGGYRFGQGEFEVMPGEATKAKL